MYEHCHRVIIAELVFKEFYGLKVDSCSNIKYTLNNRRVGLTKTMVKGRESAR